MQLVELPGRVGEIRASEWVLIDQPRIDAFADCTEDHQFIHVDPVAAAPVTGTGGTIAHGFLTLSLLGGMSLAVMDEIEWQVGVNYGFEKVRFLSPVPSGSRVRGVFTLAAAAERKPGQWLLTFDVTVEIEGGSKPALAATWMLHCTE